MTNKELIERAKQAMNDLLEINRGRLLEHEQAAYNCLRLLCERLPEDEPKTEAPTCATCGSADTYTTTAYHCRRCATTTEV